MKQADIEHVKMIAELTVRQYFDHYLQNVFPAQVEGIVKAHNEADDAHGGTIERFKKLHWTLFGIALGSGVGIGVGVDQLLPLFQ